MSVSIRITTQDPNGLSKADEMELLTKFAARFDANTYLNHLFTEPFLNEVKRRIADDWNTDVYGDLSSQITCLRAEKAVAQEDLRNAQVETARVVTLLNQREGELRVAVDAANTAWEQTRATDNELRLARRDLATLAEDGARRADALKVQITELKAQLFDLLTAAGRIA